MMGVYYTIVNYSKKEYLKCPIIDLNFNSSKYKEWCSVKMTDYLNPNHCCVRLMVYLMFHEWFGDEISFVGDEGDWNDDNSRKDITLETMAKFEKKHSILHPDYFPLIAKTNKEV